VKAACHADFNILYVLPRNSLQPLVGQSDWKEIDEAALRERDL
jgi:hypothetical protein